MKATPLAQAIALAGEIGERHGAPVELARPGMIVEA